MDLSDLITEFERLCNAPTGSLCKDSVIEAIPGWSSLAFLGIIAAVDDTYGITIRPKQVMQCSTIADMFCLLQKLQGNSKSNSNL